MTKANKRNKIINQIQNSPILWQPKI